MHCFGRPALNEGFDQGHLIGKTEIFLDGERILSEGLNLYGEDNFMKDKGMLSFPMLGTFYITSEDENLFLLVQDLLQQIQQQPHKSQLLIAVSQIEHLIVVRALAHWSEDLLSSLQQVWQLVRQQWTTQSPQPPRIWAT
jgi:urease accessory protein